MLLLLHPANADKFSMLGPCFTSKFVILVLILTACVFLYRAFCRFLCPLGAIYGLFARIALLGIRVKEADCTGCGACLRVCPMDYPPGGGPRVHPCGACMSACPEKAITMKAGKIVLKGPKFPPGLGGKPDENEKSGAGWCAALIILAVALVYFNLPNSSLSAAAPDIAPAV